MTVNFDKVFRDALIHRHRQAKNPLFKTRELLTGILRFFLVMSSFDEA